MPSAVPSLVSTYASKPSPVPGSVPSSGDVPSSLPSATTSPSVVPSVMSSSVSSNAGTPSDVPSPEPSPAATQSPMPSNDSLPNEIKALSGRKFTGDEMTTYGDAIEKKKEEMIQISGFNTNSIQLDEIRSTCQGSIDQHTYIFNASKKYAKVQETAPYFKGF